MSNINQFAISGNLTRDPELRHTNSGHAICQLGVACNRSRKDESAESGWVDEASFFDVKVWGGRGEACARKLKKGSFVTVAGRLEQERWETEDGSKRSKVVLVGQVVEGPDFFKPRSEDNATTGASEQGSLAGAAPADDDIPF